MGDLVLLSTDDAEGIPLSGTPYTFIPAASVWNGQTVLDDIEEEDTMDFEHDAPARKDAAATSAEVDDVSEDIAESNGSDEELDELVGSEADEHLADGMSLKGNWFVGANKAKEQELLRLQKYYEDLGEVDVNDGGYYGGGGDVIVVNAAAGAGDPGTPVDKEFDHEDQQDNSRPPLETSSQMKKVGLSVRDLLQLTFCSPY